MHTQVLLEALGTTRLSMNLNAKLTASLGRCLAHLVHLRLLLLFLQPLLFEMAKHHHG